MKPYESLRGKSDRKEESAHQATYFSNTQANLDLTGDDIRKGMGDNLFSEQDNAIARTLAQSLETTGSLPFIWTPQEDHFCRYLNSHKEILDYLIYRYKFKLCGREKMDFDFPIHILIEPSSICNLKCPMCFQTDSSFRTKKYMGMMDFDLYRQVIDQAAEGGAKAISLSSRGEPLLNPDFSRMLAYAAQKQSFFDIKVNTNANLLTEDHIHSIFSNNLSIVVLSIDAHHEALYDKTRIGGNFNTVVRNVEKLMNMREQYYPKSRTEIRISGVYFHPEQDEQAFYKFWKDRVDNVVFVKAQKRWDTYHNDISLSNDQSCSFLWERMFIWHDGVCSPCDEDYKSRLNIGNLNSKSIKEIWNSEFLNSIREKHLNGNRTQCYPCDRCGV